MGTRCANFRVSNSRPSLVEIERDEGRSPSPADGLFTATQRRVLAYLYGQPGRAFHLRELVELTGAGNGAVQRELRRLEQAGLVRVTRGESTRIQVQADPRCPIHAELCALVRNSFGLAEPLRQAFALAKSSLRLCFAFEPGGNELGLLLMDKMPRPDSSGEALGFARGQAELLLARSIWMITVDEQRLREDGFVAKVLAHPRIWVFGDEALLAAIAAATAPAQPAAGRGAR